MSALLQSSFQLNIIYTQKKLHILRKFDNKKKDSLTSHDENPLRSKGAPPLANAPPVSFYK
jgi:hypothetical protein